MTSEEIKKYVLSKIPAIEYIINIHTEDNFGEFIPYVFFGDFTRFVINSYNDVNLKITFNKCLELIEDMLLSKDLDLYNIAVVSFLENLHQAGEKKREILSMLLPTSKSIYNKIYGEN